MASLVDQIFEQAKLGTSVNPDANPVMQGVAAGQAQQHINLANRQLAMQLAMQPLQMEQQRQANDLQALNIQSSLLQRDLRTKGLEAFNQLQQDVHPDLTGGNIDDTLNKVVSYAGNHPVLWGTPEFVAMKDSLFKMKQEADMAKARITAANARMLSAQASQYKGIPEAGRLYNLAQEAEAGGNFEGAAQFYKQSAEAGKKAQSAPVVPVLETYGNEQFLRNPKTGHLERLNKVVNKAEFIAKNVNKWMTDSGDDADTSAQKLNDFYDKHIQPLVGATPTMGEPASPAPPANNSRDPLGILKR